MAKFICRFLGLERKDLKSGDNAARSELKIIKDSDIKSLSLKITLIYAAFGLVWVLFSDKLLNELIKDRLFLTRLQTFKGLVFIGITGYLMYLLVTRGMGLLQKTNEMLGKTCNDLEKAHEEIAAVEEELRSQLLELQEKEKSLMSSEERYRLAIEGANDGLWDWDIINDEAHISDRWQQLLGLADTKNVNHFKKWSEMVHPEDKDMMVDMLKDHLNGKIPFYICEYRIKTKDEHYIWVLARGKALFDYEGKAVRMAGSHTDITERKNIEKKIYRLAYYDLLTDLPNRILFEENLRQRLTGTNDSKIEGAVLIVGLDNFKAINDTYGNAVGDLLLKEISMLLRMIVKKDAIVSRYGGDEFACLLHDIEGVSEPTLVADTIVRAFHRPWIIEERELYSTASIGIALYPQDGADSYTIIKNANSAMHSVKEEGRDGYQIYTPQINVKFSQRLEIESKLRGAIERHELKVFYQPQVDLKSGKITGVEALLRWMNIDMGYIAPSAFIPLAETSGLIVPIGEWVLRNACSQNVEWEKKGIKDIVMSVNLSARQFQQQDLCDRIQAIIEETGISPSSLELEITESIAMKDLDSAINVLNRLKKIGVKISLDDFGTGYSSLNYLKKLPINTVKIDKTFLYEVSERSNDDAIAQAIINLSHSMKLIVIAEGVETRNQLEFLKQNNCDKGQGYLFSKPVPSDEFEKLALKYLSGTFFD